jgi:hypothetical protein
MPRSFDFKRLNLSHFRYLRASGSATTDARRVTVEWLH